MRLRSSLVNMSHGITSSLMGKLGGGRWVSDSAGIEGHGAHASHLAVDHPITDLTHIAHTCMCMTHICSMNITLVHTETCHMHDYNTQVYTRHTYMHGYMLACVHTEIHIHLHMYTTGTMWLMLAIRTHSLIRSNMLRRMAGFLGPPPTVGVWLPHMRQPYSL